MAGGEEPEGQDDTLARLSHAEAFVADLRRQRDRLLWEKERMAPELKEQRQTIRLLEAELADLRGSLSWRLTAPLRRIVGRGSAEPAPEIDELPDEAETESGVHADEIEAARIQAFEAVCANLGHSVEDVGAELDRRRADLAERLQDGELGEMVARAGALEPALFKTLRAVDEVAAPPFNSERSLIQTGCMLRTHAEAGRTARAVVLLPQVRRVAGVPRNAAHLARGLGEIYGFDEVAIVRTDGWELSVPDLFPPGCRHVDLAGTSRGLRPRPRQRMLVELLRDLRPEVVFNVNSRLFWDAMSSWETALTTSGAALYTYLFCADRDAAGYEVGYPIEFFARFFEDFRGVVTDSHFLAGQLRERFQLDAGDAARVVALDTPVPGAPPLAAAEPRRGRPQVFWAGRFDRQKRVDVVYEIAVRLPEMDFRLWGERVLDDDLELPEPPPNVTLEGVYERFEELPLGACDAWLYTSGWDGVPNLLLEVSAAAVPLVGSLSGGCGEVLLEGLAERVDDVEDVAGFVAALQRITADPEAARARAVRLREEILASRTTDAYRAQLEGVLALGARA